jgi:hypothetical protein
MFKKKWEERTTKSQIRVCMEKVPYLHKINTFDTLFLSIYGTHTLFGLTICSPWYQHYVSWSEDFPLM